nr:class II histocompatibility antigen, M beta 1 chain isoform X1 [Zootoca vivipara]
MRPLWVALAGLCLALSYLRTGAFVVHLQEDCFLSDGGRALWFNWTVAFNKIPFICFDGPSESFVPCGLGAYKPWYQLTALFSDHVNAVLGAQMKEEAQRCQGQVHSLWGPSALRQTPPKVRVFPVTPQNTPASIMLACVVWGFYPQDVTVTWLWNGALLKNGTGPAAVASSNGDWTYQTLRTLPVDPRQGGTYTCLVTHASLNESLTKDWAPGLALDLRWKVGVSAGMLGVGILLLAMGTVLWTRRVPEGYAPIDGSTYPEGRSPFPPSLPPA